MLFPTPRGKPKGKATHPSFGLGLLFGGTESTQLPRTRPPRRTHAPHGTQGPPTARTRPRPPPGRGLPAGLPWREGGCAARHPPERCVKKQGHLLARRVTCFTGRAGSGAWPQGLGPETAEHPRGGPGWYERPTELRAACPQRAAPVPAAADVARARALPRTELPGQRPPCCSFPGSGCDGATSGRTGAGRRAARCSSAVAWRPPAGSSRTLAGSSGGEETRPNTGKATAVPWHLGQGACGVGHSVLSPSVSGGRHRVRKRGRGLQLGEPWRGWGGFAGLQSRACAIPGLPATCAHPAPASASRGGHPGWPDRVLARTCSPQAPRPQNAGHGARLTPAVASGTG